MENSQSKNSPFFCVLPFVSFAHSPEGLARLCCGALPSKENLNDTPLEIIWKGEYFSEIRKKLIDGKKLKECESCYTEERVGLKSRRELANAEWGEQDKILSEELRLRYIDVKAGNLCNQKCRMCNPESSTLIAKEGIIPARRAEPRKEMYNYVKQSDYWESIKKQLPGLEKIYITGGEPTINPKVLDLLQTANNLEESKHIDLKFYTNLHQWNEAFFEACGGFKRVQFGCSIDGFGANNEYIRNPSSWSRTEKNFVKALSSDFEVLVNTTIQWYNIFELENLFKWLERMHECRSFRWHLTPVHAPSYYSIKHLPLELKNRAMSILIDLSNRVPQEFPQLDKTSQVRLQMEGLQGFLNLTSSREDSHLKQFKKITRLLDQRRDQCFEIGCPELFTFLEEL